MIRFIDIETGNVFNGDRPYIFWMDKEQSTNLIYVKKICVLTKASISVTIPENSVFKILDLSGLEYKPDVEVNGFKYKDIQDLYTNHVDDEGIYYDNYRIHLIYIAAQSDKVGEVHDVFTINGQEFEIAADFYPENESLKINLANFGVEIPESIQNTIYDTNIHEEYKDNILLNRKYKELLLNYWSIVAGRGSYQSLVDSLKWFEYGDLLKIEEVWKHDEWDQVRYSREQLNTIITSDVKSMISNFAKTTYLGIYLALEKYLIENGEVQYDKLAQTNHEATYEGILGEMTPKLENKFFKWSIQDLSLKMSLLGSFYESYFMPIHLDLLHSTIEDLVFTNTIKCLNTTHLDRADHVYNTQAFECSVKDGSVFRLQDVEVQAGSKMDVHYADDDSDDSDDTAMANVYKVDSSDDYDNYPIFGVTDEYDRPMQYPGDSSDDDIVNDRLKTFMINNYSGVGVVVPFECTIPAESDDFEHDFINTETIKVAVYKDNILEPDKCKELEQHILYKVLKIEISKPEEEIKRYKYEYHVNFNLLLTEEGRCKVTLYFSTAGGRSFVKTVHLDVVGDAVSGLKIYKVKYCYGLTGLNAEDYSLDKIHDIDPETGDPVPYPADFKSKYIRPFNDYMFTHIRSDEDQTYKTFIPRTIDDPNSNGVKLNYIIIFDASFLTDPNVSRRRKDEVLKYTTDTLNTTNLFDIGMREVRDDNDIVVKSYYILVSKASYFVGSSSSLEDIIENMKKALNGYIVRSDKGFFFQHHYLEELGVGLNSETGNYEHGLSLNDYTITDKDTVCVVPSLKYSYLRLDETEWIFRNVSTKNKEEYHYQSIKEPFIRDNVKRKLKPGFYDVIFRYRLGDEINEVSLKSAFRKI